MVAGLNYGEWAFSTSIVVSDQRVGHSQLIEREPMVPRFAGASNGGTLNRVCSAQPRFI